MSKVTAKAHPYHYSLDKNIVQRLIDVGVPVGVFYLFFQFYNFGKITPSEMVKTTGLVAITLLALTMVAGPAARFLSFLDILKAHRKVWGISSVAFLSAHIILVFIFYYKFNLLRFVDLTSPKFTGIATGIMATAILVMVTLTSKKSAIRSLDPKTWKAIQTTSYLALILAVAHFYFMEQVNGVLVIKRVLGQVAFWFSAFVILVRLFVLFLPRKSK